MKRIRWTINIGTIILTISGVVFFSSCASDPGISIINLPPQYESVKSARAFTIVDFKNKTTGGVIPEWVNLWLSSGNRGVEAKSDFRGSFVFVYSNEGNNFRALELWNDNFTPGQDFPRLAASRIEARFSAGVSYPDYTYGNFFEALIRTASDEPWTGAIRTEDSWILKKYLPDEEEGETESWEFLILLTIEKPSFTSQLESVFQKVQPDPAPSEEQIAAANNVKEHFFEGF